MYCAVTPQRMHVIGRDFAMLSHSPTLSATGAVSDVMAGKQLVRIAHFLTSAQKLRLVRAYQKDSKQ